MVTHNATILEQHLLLASELPDYHHEPEQQQRVPQQSKTCRKRGLVHNKEDPMSHRIIEKRRRDRMNNCLADLSRLIPAEYLKKGRGRIEKTEIIEMAIKHMKHLQAHACRQVDTCELAHQQQNQEEHSEQLSKREPIVIDNYRLGYQECLSETMLFLVEVEGFFSADPLCVQLVNHLQKHCDKIMKGDRLNFPRVNNGETTSSSSGSSASGGSIPLGASGMNSGSPGSGSSSDSSGRSENRDSGIGSGLPAASHGGADDGSYEDGIINLSSTSQLREMLTSPKLSSIYTPPGEKSHQGSLILHHRLQHMPQSPASPASLCASTGAADQGGGGSGASAASLYKFKNNIKQRFSAELHVEGNEGNNDTAPGHISRTYEMMLCRKRHNFDVNRDHEDSKSTLTLNMLRRRDSDTCSISSLPHSPPLPPVNKFPRVHSPLMEAPHSPPPPHRPMSTPSYGVPIFALDFKGSYYVPLTLDMEILAPYFTQLGFGQDVGNSSSPLNVVLHPVTISVNFQHANQHRIVQNPPQRQRHFNFGCAPVPAWKTE